MSYFLQLVARDLRSRFSDLSRVTVVFPNKRAGLFLNDYLVEEDTDDRPLWAPRYVTISELFRDLSDLVPNDPIDSACRLHARYVEMLRDAGHGEVPELSLDLFLGWAERILADFDDVDKNMADARQLFRNLEDLKEIESSDFLTDEQKDVISHFFATFDPERKSELRERFRRLWDCLLPLYEHLNAELSAEGKAYEGALYRRVVEALCEERSALPDEVEAYAVVGFNVLDRAETGLFEAMQRAGKALFYWDYDVYYADPYRSRGFEAGLFIEENLRRFPNALPAEHFDNLRRIEQIEMVAATSEAAQAQSATGWLENHLPSDPAEHRRTAVVLCNETMLQPVLRVFPESVRQVNVTKGFPLGHTEANTVVEQRLADYERRGVTRSAREVLEGLSACVTERAKALTAREGFDTRRFDDVLQSEAFYLMVTLLNRLSGIAAAGRLDVNVSTLRRVVRRIVRQTTVPFHGEPAVGLQVLGVLETRCLDFDDVLMLSVNEGMLPQTPADNSFIPYMLRRAFGLTTPERRTAVYAYYFFRLIQRAKRLRMVFNTSTDGISTGEMSRFMMQLRVDRSLPVRDVALTVPLDSRMHRPLAVPKPDDLTTRLIRKADERRPAGRYPALSPSAINTYMRCELKFYYQYVCGFREPEANPDEGIQANLLGTLFHDAAEGIYARVLREHGGTPPPGYLAALARRPQDGAESPLREYVEAAFVRNGFAVDEIPPLESGVVELYLRILLEDDARAEGLRIRELEQWHSMDLPLPEGAAAQCVTIGGKIDRLDEVVHDGRRLLRVLDYKTGGEPESASHVEQLFELRGKKHRHYMLQTFIYSAILHGEHRTDGLPVAPTLYFVQKARARKGYSPYLQVDKREVLDFEHDIPGFSERLSALAAEILDPDRPFVPVNDNRVCGSCAYRALCYR